ncbi:KptA family-domain-containing protein [Fusarium tricinctum]|uniref:2'-phosphotransferase n=1 Tax=Fusarium tricinctum TaxID=61284 RepID=A0A8K0WEW4_9HYPO|nr:KptA family-domain-containing protein [Fusarium tricinctum]
MTDTTQQDHLDVEERMQSRTSRPRGDKGRGKGGGGGGGGQGREVQVSKALSKLLRHQAANAGVQLDDEGYAALDSVLAWGPLRSLKVTLEDIQAIVSSNDKQRFTLKPKDPSLETPSNSSADYLIRANQGHSIKLESAALHAPITIEAGNVPQRVLHGSFFYFWPAIVETGGLKPMSRTHVHCSSGTPEEGVVSGMRKDAELIIEVDIEASLKDGVKWWLSDNGVLLTEGDEQGILSTKYFKSVTGRKVDIGVLWQDGEWVSDLPAGLKISPPLGKGPRRGGGRGGRGGRRGGS